VHLRYQGIQFALQGLPHLQVIRRIPTVKHSRSIDPPHAICFLVQHAADHPNRRDRGRTKDTSCATPRK
jgi:hypothetical protein